MKKIISLVVAFLLVSVIALQGKIKGVVIHEKVLTKTIEFSIFLANSYSSALYKNSKAKVVLTVYKLNTNNKEILWNAIVDKGTLNEYPLFGKRIYKRLTVFNIKEHSDSLVASYKITYNTRGSEFSYEQNYLIELTKGNAVTVAL
jgi:hypothetical protein